MGRQIPLLCPGRGPVYRPVAAAKPLQRAFACSRRLVPIFQWPSRANLAILPSRILHGFGHFVQ
jgi:hypothetical protein